MKSSDHHITRRTAILGPMVLSASALVPTYVAARGTSGKGPEWLQENLVPVRSLDSADESYDDLMPLADAIGTARLVLLGESSHGAGSDFKAKVRLIKFLCQRMDFDVVVWESGFHAMEQVNAELRAMGDPVAAAKRGIYTIWSDTEEVEPLFKWVQSSWKTRRPIEMAGFDVQITAAGAEDLLFADLRQFAAGCPNAALRKSLQANVERAIAAYQKTNSPHAAGEVTNVGQAASNILQIIDGHRKLLGETNGDRRLSFLERTLENFRTLAQLRFEAAQGKPGSVSVQLKDPTHYFDKRDEENARNIRWLLDVGYPGRKIIVWAHNVHISKLGFGPNFGPLTQRPRPNDMIPMGRLISERMRDDCYALGLTSYDGEDAWANGSKTNSIPAVPPHSLEAKLHVTGRPYGFLNLRGHRSLGEYRLKQRIFVPAEGSSTTASDGIFPVSNLPDVFDGVFFIDHMTPATPIRSG